MDPGWWCVGNEAADFGVKQLGGKLDHYFFCFTWNASGKMEFRKTTVAGNNVCEVSFASPDGYGFGKSLLIFAVTAAILMMTA